MRLLNKKVLVVGGSSGIGLAVAKMAQSEGAQVIIAGRTPEKLEKAKSLIGSEVELVPMDVMEPEAIAKAFEKIGSLDHIFISAQSAATSALSETTIEKLGTTLNSKIWGALYVVKQATPHLSNKGSITFISGLAGRRGYANFAVAGASNAGIEAVARNLAVELSPIRVNTVCAGVIDTDMLERVFGDSRDEVVQSIAEKLPVKRIGQPEEVADAVLFLMNNGFATGMTLLLDGGDALV